jgi:hypothetical protein
MKGSFVALSVTKDPFIAPPAGMRTKQPRYAETAYRMPSFVAA